MAREISDDAPSLPYLLRKFADGDYDPTIAGLPALLRHSVEVMEQQQAKIIELRAKLSAIAPEALQSAPQLTAP